MIATVRSAALIGIQAYPVQIQVDVSAGLPRFDVVGLPDTGIKEARERVRAAVKNSGYEFPYEKITVNLAPADLKKEGPAFDLPMALGILVAQGILPQEKLDPYIFMGELALDGKLCAFKGAVVLTSSLKTLKKAFIVPAANGGEAALEKNCTVYAASHLQEVVRFLLGENLLPQMTFKQEANQDASFETIDFSEVKGQACAKRAIEIAVAGAHNLLLIGPPGAGKSMLSKRIPTILPPLEFEEALEITKIYSVSSLNQNHSFITRRPFRSPHHSISLAALTGGGSWPKPGEISLAHGGVLFLDEFPEFRRDVVESLRGPMEDQEVTVSRAKMQITFPSRFFLVAAMNPCPCGHLGERGKTCRCSLGNIRKYQAKVSGPILDRIDLHIQVPSLSYQMLTREEHSESSTAIRERVIRARQIQQKRYHDRPFKTNALMRARDIRMFAPLSETGRKLLERAMKELHLSARAYYKILKIARTIADLEESNEIGEDHLAEAIHYRALDRQWSG